MPERRTHCSEGTSFGVEATNWDVAPDGEEFVLVRSKAATPESSSLNVVLNWFDQLRAQRR